MKLNIHDRIGKGFGIVLLGLAGTLVSFAGVTKVACVGDSITYGYGIGDREHVGYPAVLGKLLGPAYEVKNFGNSGKTAGDYPSQKKIGRWYGDTPQYRESVGYAADVYICNLGINDTGAWWDTRLFEKGYDDLLASWHKASPKAIFFAWGQLGPDYRGQEGRKAFPGNVFAPTFQFRDSDNGSSLKREEAEKLIGKVAEKYKVNLFDACTPLADKPQWYGDGLHPNAEGASRLAEITFARLVPILKIAQPQPSMSVKEGMLEISNAGETAILLEWYAVSGPGGAIFVFGKDTVLHPGKQLTIILGEKTANDPTGRLSWNIKPGMERSFKLRPLKKPLSPGK